LHRCDEAETLAPDGLDEVLSVLSFAQGLAQLRDVE
jgi:hypothetical protein